jgi:hypothetical protein
MSRRDVAGLVRQTRAPGEREARGRAWPVVRAAHASRPRAVVAGSRRGRALALALALGGALAVALTPAGTAIARWVRSTVGTPSGARTAPRLGALPGGGRLLVTSSTGAWVVNPGGERRRLGDWTAASWSPHGLFVVVAAGRELAAVDPVGRVHWALTAAEPVSGARWSPDGFRIAYRAGDRLRVVAGDGTGDHLLARATAPLAPVWRPGPGHKLAFVAPRARVVVAAADPPGGVAFSAPAGADPRQLAWSSDGRRLAIVGAHGVRLLDARGHLRGTIPLDGRSLVAAFAPRGRRLAILRYRPLAGESDVLVAPPGRRLTTLLATPGRFAGLAWAPDCLRPRGASPGSRGRRTAGACSSDGPPPANGCSCAPPSAHA